MTYAVDDYPNSVALGDFDGDGKVDLAVTNATDDAVGVLSNRGDGTFAAQLTFPAGQDPFAVAVGDFNGDGRADLAVANQADDTVSVLLNDCAP